VVEETSQGDQAMNETRFTIGAGMRRKKYGETSFGERLVAIRKARGLTQVRLAEAVQVSQTSQKRTKKP
jgi:hypothetical protein